MITVKQLEKLVPKSQITFYGNKEQTDKVTELMKSINKQYKQK
jgi:hypothetical protein